MMTADAKHSFTVKVRVAFSAAHHIRGYDGDCARPHGHNYKVEAHAAYPTLNSIGLAVDFKDLKKILQTITQRFDHQDINTIAPFTDINPTAETLARYFFHELKQKMTTHPATAALQLFNITIWETDEYAASYGLE